MSYGTSLIAKGTLEELCVHREKALEEYHREASTKNASAV